MKHSIRLTAEIIQNGEVTQRSTIEQAGIDSDLFEMFEALANAHGYHPKTVSESIQEIKENINEQNND